MKARRGVGDPPPPRKRLPVYDLVYPKPAQPLDVTILSPYWQGIVTHWLPGVNGQKGRTLLCRREGQCPRCGPPNADTWNGYLAVWLNASRRRAILTLTDRGVDALDAVVPDNEDLRGQRLWCARSTLHPSSLVTFSRHENKPQTPVPVPHDIWHTLRVVYGDDDVATVIARATQAEGQR